MTAPAEPFDQVEVSIEDILAEMTDLDRARFEVAFQAAVNRKLRRALAEALNGQVRTADSAND